MRALAHDAAARAKAEAGQHRAWVWGNAAEEYHAVEAGLERMVLEKTALAPGEVPVVMPPGVATLFNWDLSALEPIGEMTFGPNLGVTIISDFFWRSASDRRKGGYEAACGALPGQDTDGHSDLAPPPQHG